MKTSKIKKTLSLILILSFIIGWFHAGVCEAQEGQQTMNEDDSQAEVKSPGMNPPDSKEDRTILDHPLADIIKLPLVVASMPILACLFLTYGILGKDIRAFIW